MTTGGAGRYLEIRRENVNKRTLELQRPEADS